MYELNWKRIEKVTVVGFEMKKIIGEGKIEAKDWKELLFKMKEELRGIPNEYEIEYKYITED